MLAGGVGVVMQYGEVVEELAVVEVLQDGDVEVLQNGEDVGLHLLLRVIGTGATHVLRFMTGRRQLLRSARCVNRVVGNVELVHTKGGEARVNGGTDAYTVLRRGRGRRILGLG